MKEREPLIVGQHYPAIDGLRGLAVLLVVWFHASYFVSVAIGEQLEGLAWGYYIFSVMGETGVDLFFVLSGFLITGILIDTRHQKHNLKYFYIRRTLRIFPLYYGVLFIFLAYFLFALGLDQTAGGLDHTKIVMHLAYVQNWLLDHNDDQFMLLSHTWSLAVEEQFYLFWPLVFLSFYKREKPHTAIIICLVMIIISWVLRLYFGAYEAYKWAYTFTPSRFDQLALGALLAILCSQKQPWLVRWRKTFPYVIAACFAVITALLFAGALQKGNMQGANDFSVVYGLIFFSVLYVSLLAYVFLSGEANLLKRILSTKPMRTIGKISYGMYIFHSPVMFLLTRYIYDNYALDYWTWHIIVLLAGGGISFVLAYLSYHFYEVRFLRLKDKYAPLES